MTFIAVCLKWVPGRPEVDSLSGEVHQNGSRFGGVSPADLAALEVALQLGQQRTEAVTAITVGDDKCDQAMHDALAAGAQQAIRINVAGTPSSSETARVLASVLGNASLVMCGDYSADRGSGSVPAYLAAELGIMQALGVVALDFQHNDILLTRRLDKGRREHLRVSDRTVISVEGSIAQLRRASLQNTLATRNTHIQVIDSLITGKTVTSTTKPFRPRPRSLAQPHGTTALERLHSITDVATASTRGEQIELTSAKSAMYILDTLARWGYIEHSQ